MSTKPLLLLAVLVGLTGAQAQLTADERKGIEDVLYVGNLTPTDLEFPRRSVEPPLRTTLIDLALDKPLEAADALMGLHATATTGDLSALLDTARLRVLEDRTEVRPLQVAPGASGADALPQAVRVPIERLALNLAQANADIREALKGLSAEEQRYLIENLPPWAVEEPSIRFEFAPRPNPDQPRILALLAKVNLPMIRRAAVVLAKSCEQAARELLSVAPKPVLSGFARFVSYGTKVVVGGAGDEHHTDRDALLTVDLGGNDRYTGRHGAGPGYASVLIDLAGDDVYDVPDLSVGAAVLGIGLAYDWGGNDTFRGKSLAFGAGLAGVGALYKQGGEDVYSALSLAQGYGQFGVGVCLDTGGDDRYDLKFQGQGAARTQGVGWLADRSGRDAYRAGGLILNSPLFKDVHYSNAQGYGAGYREDTGGLAGGVGLLTDLAGDDSYVGETYCQAASYWFSVGSLYDAAGHDTYSAYHYAQSSAMHLCGAYLFDLAGDDAYAVKFGAAHAIGHDYAVAVLFDRAGNDVVAGRDSRPGTGNANGLGLFVDARGDDRYFGPPAAGNAARGSGSLGVFADLEGSDRYGAGLVDGGATARESWAVALDVNSSPAAPPPLDPTRATPVPGTASLPAPSELERLYARATQWGVGTAQEEVADALDRLVSIGEPALRWMLQSKLKTATRLHIRAFSHVVNALGDPGRAMLAPYASDPDDDVARVAITVAMDTRATQVAEHLAAALQRPVLQRLAARAAGALKAAPAVPELMVLAASQDRLLALAAVVSLAQIGDPQALGTGQFLLGSQLLPIRKAAIQLVAGFPSAALATGKLLMQEPDEAKARTGVELLGILGSAEALDAAGAGLSDGRAGVRIQALLVLAGRCPESHRAKFASLRQDPHPLVRAVARQSD